MACDCGEAPRTKAERNRAYYQANREREKLRAKAWRDANPDKVSDAKKEWRARNPGRAEQLFKAYRERNLEELKAKRRANYWANRERDLACAREWKARNRDAAAALVAKRGATKKRATPSWANEFFIREAYHLARVRSRVCGGKWHVDHIVPLQSKFVCGLHCEANLQVIPARFNQSKSNRTWPDMP